MTFKPRARAGPARSILSGYTVRPDCAAVRKAPISACGLIGSDLPLDNILDEAYREHLSPSLGTVLEEGFSAKIAATIRFGATGPVQ